MYNIWLRLVASKCSRQPGLCSSSRRFLAQLFAKAFGHLSNEVIIRSFDRICYVWRISNFGYVNEFVFILVLEFRSLYFAVGTTISVLQPGYIPIIRIAINW